MIGVLDISFKKRDTGSKTYPKFTMEQVLRICPCKEQITLCNACRISKEFNVGHLKMLYIRCLPTETDIINVLILLLIEVSNSVNDFILKSIQPFDRYFTCRYYVHHLDIASKKALYHMNVCDLQDTGFDLINPSSKDDVIFKCRLGLKATGIVDSNWKFCDVKSQLISFWFNVTSRRGSTQ